MIATEPPTQERRSIPRFPVNSGLFAINFQLGQIIDISMDGLAFRYVERLKKLEGDRGVGIIFDEDDLCFDRIPVQTITDIIVSDEGDAAPPIVRRCGVMFLDLSPTQKSLLQNFIWFSTYTGHNDHPQTNGLA